MVLRLAWLGAYQNSTNFFCCRTFSFPPIESAVPSIFYAVRPTQILEFHSFYFNDQLIFYSARQGFQWWTWVTTAVTPPLLQFKFWQEAPLPLPISTSPLLASIHSEFALYLATVWCTRHQCCQTGQSQCHTSFPPANFLLKRIYLLPSLFSGHCRSYTHPQRSKISTSSIPDHLWISRASGPSIRCCRTKEENCQRCR